MQAIYKLPFLLEPQLEGGFTVTCPLLPELITEGDTVKEALANASDALTAIIEAYEDLVGSLPSALKQVTINEDKMKELLRDIMIEMIREKKDIFYEIIVESIEDIGLANAIKEGRKDQFVAENRIMDKLES